MARKKTKMRSNKVKRVKKTRNSRRTKRNTRRRNKRGGDFEGSWELIKGLSKGVSGAVGRSLKENLRRRYDKFSKKYLKRKTDKKNEGLLDATKAEANAKAKAEAAEAAEAAKANKKRSLEDEAKAEGIDLKSVEFKEFLEEKANKKARDSRDKLENDNRSNVDYGYGGNQVSIHDEKIYKNPRYLDEHEQGVKKREYKALRDLFPRDEYPNLY